MSISGSLDLAVDRAVAIGCECLQIFYGSPRQWRTTTYGDDTIRRFVDKRRAAHLDPLVAHAAYLVNLGAPERALRHRSIASLLATTRGVERLEGLGTVTHLGSAMGSARRGALRRVATAIRQTLSETEHAMILLENSAGMGDALGATFEDMADVLHHLDGHARVGVCLDTAHLFAAGWNLKTPAGVDAMVGAADRLIGWGRIRVLHLNDSRAGLGSHVDRHENIGEGQIGTVGFRAIITHPRVRPLAGILETPGFGRKGPDRRNLTRLRRLTDGRRESVLSGRRTNGDSG